ncbi:MAG: cation diffusion facilitator family transporter [Actinomycetota bacterium]|nr:cation diffusion facilitator family transporter [Actinomycetota bacterium]
MDYNHQTTVTKRKIAIFSLVVSIVLVIIKVLVAYFSNSLGVFSEALNNGLDLVTVFIAFIAIRMASKPPDADHTYGHGKYENFAAFAETTVISGLGVFIIYKSIQRLIYQNFVLSIGWPVFLVLGISVALNIVRVAVLAKAAKKFDSFTFRAEFLNYSGDIVSSLVVIAGLIFAGFGVYVADPIASIIVAVVVIVLSIRLSVSIVKNLLDYVPVQVTRKIEKTLTDMKDIDAINDLKVHEVGGIKFINLSLNLANNLYLTQAENIKDEVREKIRQQFPNSNIIVELKPKLADGNISDYIKQVALDQPEIKDVHNIFLYSVGRYTDISVHVELANDMSLQQVEELTSQTEQKIREKVKDLRKIYIHSEDLSGYDSWEDVTLNSEKLIQEIKDKVTPYIDPGTCHDFTVLRKGKSYHVAFHCRMDSKLKIEQAHRIITEAEYNLRTQIKQVDEVLIHAEPS